MIGVYDIFDGIVAALFSLSLASLTLAIGGGLMEYAITHNRRFRQFLERLFKTNLV